MKNKRLITALQLQAESDREKALMTLELLVTNPLEVGDHTAATSVYRHAEIALCDLADAENRLQVLKDYYLTESNGH
jgi:hypothetical protein